MVSIVLKPDWAQRIQKGYPWVYTHSIASSIPPAITAGELVYLYEGKRRIAIAYFNPQTKLCARVLSCDPNATINEDFFYEQFSQALKRRQVFCEPYYRLVHSEGDNLPGLIVDRFNDTLVCQTNTAGMEKLKPLWLNALQKLLSPNRIIFRDDAPIRAKEGLALCVSAPLGSLSSRIEVQENSFTFYVDPEKGQKTGWFFDQRANRQWISQRVRQKTVLDLYTYLGGFGIACAARGAKQVTLVDASDYALSLAKEAAEHNGVVARCNFIKEDVFDLLPKLIEAGQQFEVVIADPPAFVKQALNKGSGLRGYEKLAKLVSQVLAPKGMLFIASCSHHASHGDFREAVERGIHKANREARLVRKAGADRDHPFHRLLAQSQYLKSLAYQFTS